MNDALLSKAAVRHEQPAKDLRAQKSPSLQDDPSERPSARSFVWANAVRYVETARRLTPRQALYWAVRRTIGRSYHVPRSVAAATRSGITLDAMIATRASGLEGNRFDFLSTFVDLGHRIDWKPGACSRLWQYNLHYFDYALDRSRSPGWIAATMSDWVAANPPAQSVGWEPYPVSLRVVNWIKVDLHSEIPVALLPDVKQSLYRQVWWLEGNLEHEIQANHLLKNAKALVFGGAYFGGPDADRWLTKGTRLFLDEVEKQFLPDGAHFERSAMYHAIALEDMLDVLSLALSNRGLLSSSAISQLTCRIQAALQYLHDIQTPSGDLPMFNDSVAGIAPDVCALAAYAQRLLPDLDLCAADPVCLIDKHCVALYGYRHRGEMLIIDGGGPAPDCQPGHSHCGLLGFELVIDGRTVIVDSGVYDYENSLFRRQLRSTAAHNTVRIDGQEQSDIWGAFRIARRARSGGVSLRANLPQWFRFAAQHDGYHHLPGSPTHHRMITSEIGRRWHIVDQIIGRGHHRLESFLHFHPSLRLRPDGIDIIVLDDNDRALFRVGPQGGDTEIAPAVYCPRFGTRQNNWMLTLSTVARLPITMSYVIEKV